MTIQALSNFITVTDSAGVVQHRYQNSKVGEVIRLDGFDFYYLSFLYQGGVKNRTGDNIESELYLAPNKLAMSIVQEAVLNDWRVEVSTCSMNPNDFSVGRTLTTESWLCTSFNYDTENLTLLLSSGIDAVTANAPSLRLTSKMVGALPSTGQIYNR